MPREFSRVGGAVCLDFVNTVDRRGGSGQRDRLLTYADVIRFAGTVSVLTPGWLDRLQAAAGGQPDWAAATHARVVQFRESLRAVLVSALSTDPVDLDDLGQVNLVLRAATEHHVLVAAAEGGVRDGWFDDGDLLAPLWPVAVDAWDLLTTGALSRWPLRLCTGPDGACGHLFLDRSRRSNRRWCDMRTCGNRAKARAHYQRRRGAAAAGGQAPDPG